MTRFTFALIIVLGLGSIAFNSAVAQSAEPKLRLAKSSIIYLTAPRPPYKREKDLNGKELKSYVPAGTWVQTLGDSWRKRLLVQTEHGIFGYIAEKYLWNASDLKEFSRLGTVAIFKQNHSYYEKDMISLWFTRSESYRVAGDGDETGRIKIEVDLTKKIVRDGSKQLIKTEGNVPAIFEADVKEHRVKIIDFKQDLSEQVVNFRLFDTHVANGIQGLRKECYVTELKAIKTKIGGDLEFTSFFASIGLGASRETETIENLGANLNIERTYYVDKSRDAKYKLDRRKDCTTNQNTFSFLKIDEGKEIIILKEWLTNFELPPVEPSEGRVRLTCPRDYFTFDKALSKQFDPAERAFLITKVADFKDFDSNCEPLPTSD